MGRRKTLIIPGELAVLNPDDPCAGCGACCRHMVWVPFCGEVDPEWQQLKRERPDLAAGIEFDRKMRMTNRDEAREDYPCLWLDRETGRCRHYEYRPITCREFEPGSRDCAEARAKYGLAPLPAETRARARRRR
jgi:Fe-S-cluster containining protein